MKTEVQRFLSWNVWHDLDRTGRYYKTDLGIDFPTDLTAIKAAVRDRHGIVHRNGKSMSGVLGTWGVAEIVVLKETVSKFASEVEEKINQLPAPSSSSGDDYLVDI